MNDHLRCLCIIRHLSIGSASLDSLMVTFDVSRATIKRDIAAARHLGAKIISFRSGSAWLYRLENWAECSRTVQKWIELEEKRDLTLLI
jgi:DeoR/GlpR family transcriptional regulator of sugar metabolism